MSKRILIIGCGQLGRRHLQAVSVLKEVGHVTVVDENPAALKAGQQFLTQLDPPAGPGIEFCWSGSLQSNGSFDVCVVATQSPGRCALIKEIVDKTSCRYFLIEKIVVQSAREYKDLMEFASAHHCRVWVNCKTRAYKIHQYIKQKIVSGTPLQMSVVGGNHGLANNGVHAADLFAFYEGGGRIEPAFCRVDDQLHPSKRGAQIFDLSGTLAGTTARGSEFILSFAGGHTSPDVILINTPECRFWVDHFQQMYFESYSGDGWAWRRIEMPENLAVSTMTKTFVSEILSQGQCRLPTLEECFVGHEFILNMLIEPFSRLLGRPLTACPVT